MNVHKNARLTPRGRERIVRQVTITRAPLWWQVSFRRNAGIALKITDYRKLACQRALELRSEPGSRALVREVH